MESRTTEAVVRSSWAVVVGAEATKGDRFHFFIVTGSDKVPVVCLNNNAGGKDVYPRILFAHNGTHQGKTGIHVLGTLTGPAPDGWALSFGFAQPDMKGDFTVIPIL